MKIEIVDATLPMLTYVAANARAIDKEELVAAGPETPTHAAIITWHCTQGVGGLMHAVLLDGNPEVVFGATRQSELTPWLYSGWMWGTEKTAIVMPEMYRWGYTDRRWVRSVLGHGCRRLEVRSIAHHHESHRWLTHMGATREADLIDWGRNGARFVLFAWRASDFGEEFDVRSISAVRTAARSGTSAGSAGEGRQERRGPAIRGRKVGRKKHVDDHRRPRS
jgi:hypothetical protein